MKGSENKMALFNKMKDFMRNDRAQHTILPLSKFGLMAITRQRVREEVKIDTSETCPTCLGTGKSKASVLVIDDIKRDLTHIISSRPNSKIKLVVHPFIFAYLKRGIISVQVKWYKEFKKWIKIKENNDFQMLEYKFFDELEDEIRLD